MSFSPTTRYFSGRLWCGRNAILQRAETFKPFAFAPCIAGRFVKHNAHHFHSTAAKRTSYPFEESKNDKIALTQMWSAPYQPVFNLTTSDGRPAGGIRLWFYRFLSKVIGVRAAQAVFGEDYYPHEFLLGAQHAFKHVASLIEQHDHVALSSLMGDELASIFQNLFLALDLQKKKVSLQVHEIVAVRVGDTRVRIGVENSQSTRRRYLEHEIFLDPQTPTKWSNEIELIKNSLESRREPFNIKVYVDYLVKEGFDICDNKSPPSTSSTSSEKPLDAKIYKHTFTFESTLPRNRSMTDLEWKITDMNYYLHSRHQLNSQTSSRIFKKDAHEAPLPQEQHTDRKE